MVHYCAECHTWYHEPCLAIVGPLSELRPPAHRLPRHLTAHRRVDRLWGSILAIPISRRYRRFSEDQFCTFESVLLAAREYGDNPPPNIGEWIESAIRHAPYPVPASRVEEAMLRLRLLADTPLRHRLVFKCQTGHFI